MQDSRGKADWMSFVLHFLFGLAGGAVLGVLSIASEHRIWMRGTLILPFLSGTALLAAGLGAKLGDRLWMGNSYQIIAPDAPGHSRFSRWLCDLSMLVGITLAATSLFKQFFR